VAIAPRSRYFTLAHRYVSVAIYNGDLPRLDGLIPCEDCGRPAQEYDHRDYKKPLEVSPVCRECNAARGPGLHHDPVETAMKPLTLRQRFDCGIRGVAMGMHMTPAARFDCGTGFQGVGPAPSESEQKVGVA